MTRQSLQRGYVSEPRNTSRGMTFTIRYRIRSTAGKWVHKSETLYDLTGKKAARAILNKRIQESSNRSIQQIDMTFQEFLEGFWRPYLDRKNVKASTKQSYDCYLKVHVLPRFGEMRILDIAPGHIEAFVRARGEAGGASKTIRNLLALLQSIFSLAVENDVIPRSPIRRCHKPSLNRTEKPVWSAFQVRAIIEAVPAKYQALFKAAALTGARLGEVLGLQWKHLDLPKGVLHICQSLWNGEVQSPKTQASNRRIYMGEVLLETLTRHKGIAKWTAPDNFVFCKDNGQPFQPDVLRKVLYSALDRAEISRSKRESGFHTFRHSAASFINSETGNLKLAQHLLGHATLDMTAGTYTHISDSSARDGASALEKAIYGDLFVTVRETEEASMPGAVN